MSCIQLCNQLSDFCNISCEYYAIRGYLSCVHVNFLCSIIITWQTYKLMRWEWHVMRGPEIVYDNGFWKKFSLCCGLLC